MTRSKVLAKILVVLAGLALALGFAGSAAAQSLDPALGVPDLHPALLYPAPFSRNLLPPPPFQPARPAPPRLRMSPGQRRAWLVLAAADHSASFFDARTTRVAIRNYQELNPLLRPFAHSAALYPAMQVVPFGLDLLASRLATSRYRWLRRLWWLPQSAATVGHLWAGAHNMGLPAPSGAPQP
ncbi:MAG TPA: hypothetical protein VGS20_12365 [Candidatus Acidoferrales bacterium]|nr:hypothetical protein [Candidatus Acidoferrales bacterium]